jgi:hypothetical protein
MRASHVATALAAFTAGLTAATVRHRRAERLAPAAELPPAAVTAAPATAPAVDHVISPEGVVLPFLRPVVAPAAIAEQPAGPARCGDTGGRTKAGAPCAARAAAGGRCHHHPLAA